MRAIGWIVVAVFALGVLVAGCVALVNDEDSLGPPIRVQLVSHEYDCDPEWGDCGGGYGGGQEYDQWRNEDRNRNRNRNRGAFSPGPFDRSPVDFSNSCISLDCSGRDEGRRRDRPPSEEPMATQSLFPIPTPDGIRQFVLSAIEGGIALGRLFANATIDFVSSIMVGIA